MPLIKRAPKWALGVLPSAAQQGPQSRYPQSDQDEGSRFRNLLHIGLYRHAVSESAQFGGQVLGHVLQFSGFRNARYVWAQAEPWPAFRIGDKEKRIHWGSRRVLQVKHVAIFTRAGLGECDQKAFGRNGCAGWPSQARGENQFQPPSRFRCSFIENNDVIEEYDHPIRCPCGQWSS